jgi:hypothetical protein
MAKHAAAYAHKVNKVTISGTCFAGTEEWSTGFYLGDTGADAADPGTVTASAIHTHWTTFFTHANAHIATTYLTTQIKVSQLQTDGDVDLEKIDIYDYPTAIAGVSGGAPLPPQLTLAATLTSDRQRGLASKGRMYLPGINLPIFAGDPHVSSTEQGQIATQLKTFFDSVNADANIGGYAVLASKGIKITDSQDPKVYYYEAGITARLTGLRVGNVYDTQRRRRGDVVEVYTSRVLA